MGKDIITSGSMEQRKQEKYHWRTSKNEKM